MYKSRLNKWNVFKYCRRTDASKTRATGGKGPSGAAAAQHKRPKVAAHYASNKKIHAPTPSSAVSRRQQQHFAGGAAAVAAVRGLLRSPDDLRLPEECLNIVDGYAQGAAEQRLWALDSAGLLAPSAKLTTVNNLTDVTLTVLLPRRPEFAFRVLRVCFDKYGELIRQEQNQQQQQHHGDTPWLFLSTYAFVLRTAGAWPDLARCFLRYCRDLARIVHPAGHPYPRLLDAMCRMGPARMEACAADLLESCILAIERRFGSDSHCMAFALVYVTNICVFAQSLRPDVAGSKLRALLARVEGRGGFAGEKGGAGAGAGGGKGKTAPAAAGFNDSSLNVSGLNVSGGLSIRSRPTPSYCDDAAYAYPDPAAYTPRTVIGEGAKYPDLGNGNGNGNGAADDDSAAAVPLTTDLVPGLRLSLMRLHYRTGDKAAARRIAAGVPAAPAGAGGRDRDGGWESWSWAYGLEIMRLAYETPRPSVPEILRLGHLWGAVVKTRGIAGAWASAPLVEFRDYLDRYAGDAEAEVVRHALEVGMEFLCQLVCDDFVCGDIFRNRMAMQGMAVA